MTMTLDPWLLEVLVCPSDKGPLLYLADEDTLYNPRIRLRYRVEDGIPVMLTEEAETVDGTEHRRLLSKTDSDGMANAEADASGAGSE